MASTSHPDNTTNITRIADDVVFAIGDLMKYKTINTDAFRAGIRLCDDIVKGRDISPDKMTIDEMPKFEKFKVLEKNKEKIEAKGINYADLHDVLKQVAGYLEQIIGGEDVHADNLRKAQKVFIAVSIPFWRENVMSFHQRKISKGLRIHA
jgi:hypothetical protein